MLDIKCPEYFAEVMRFATQTGLTEQLMRTLIREAEYANGEGCAYDQSEGKNTKCEIYSDFAPHSFRFNMLCQKEPDGEWEFWFNGGIIYQGPEQPADGSAPSFTVSLNSGTGWFVHT